MGKVKESSKTLAVNKAIKATNCTTTPLKTMYGKVHKVRVNVKNLKLQKNSDSLKSSDLPNLQKSVSSKARLCFVKLKRTHIKDKDSSQNDNEHINNNTMQDQCKVIQKDVIEENKKRSPLKIKKNVEKNLVIVNDTTIIDDIPSKATGCNNNSKTACSKRKCLVRLRRSPVMKKLTEKGETSKTEEVIDLTTNESPSIVAALDEVKRNNFRKLSLNQSPIIKSNKKNKDTNKESNIITKSPNKNTEAKLKETEGQIFKHTNGKESDSSESKPIRNNTEREITTHMPSVQLQHVKKLKRVQKLSLKKLSNKSKFTTNLEITQFEPQQNSTICFQPARNSTLLEFGFVKDKNKKKQIKENNINREKEKNDISPSKNQSSSQNFANKSQEIENLLNSLDEDENDNNKENQIEVNLKDQDQDKENENLSSAKNQSSSQNLFIKSKENANLLNYCVEYENDKAEENQTKNSQISKKTNKFFHRDDKTAKENILKVLGAIENKSLPKNNRRREKNLQENILNQVKNKSKSTGATKKRPRLLTKRSSISKRDKVYEFLSQSQTSDSDSNKHLDPAADIIKRLIDEGRVQVATNCKGKGRPILKRKAPNKQQKKRIKQNAATRKEKLLRNKIPIKEGKTPDGNENPDHIDNDDHFMDDFDHNEPLPEVQNEIEQQPQEQGVKKLTHQNHHISDQEGTFSPLARSVLIKQSARSDLQREKAKRLLEMAKKFVSTPKNKKTLLTHEDLHSDLSPIAMPPPRSAGKASPWRIDEDAHLPRIFNFTTSSGNLPSFSSDFIPYTPRKETHKKKTILQQESTQPQSPPSATNIPNSIQNLAALSPRPITIETTPPATNKPSVLSSYSSNDSDAENMPPPTAIHENYNENNNIFDLKQLPNPKRALNYRSPLKAINILEVVHLPPYKPNANISPQPKDTEKDNVNLFRFEENLNNDSIVAESDSVGTKPQNTPAKIYEKSDAQQENLFGFEDFLTQTDFSSEDCCDDERENETIHDKLKGLRKLRPEGTNLQLSLHKEESRIPQKTFALFDDKAASGAIDADGMRQRGIKEMLCSTMINEPQPSTSKEALAQLKKRNLIDLERPNFDEGLNLIELFKDPEPETTLNENDPHRTYIRPHKRKRRLKENKFVMFLDSDESGDGHDSAEHQKHHHSNETDTSSEKSPKKKRQRKQPKENPELTEFVHNFEEMCKEVDSYELIVERSA